jgi:hypothetical protein
MNRLKLSLDEVLAEDGSATRGNTVSRGMWRKYRLILARVKAAGQGRFRNL